MTGKAQRESAKIYQFPAGGRTGLEAERAAWRSAMDPSVPYAKVVCGSSWYHDEAVREADQSEQHK
ncbi:DUF2735 domain-containing protein [Hyphomicrobium sp. CS1GBMeth3]|uniref:DUF2735 domain-containing protein n=1 Tax=Hyphomicrobium sp. CS1GBMeth3 TaxID=1892845 RepID=UPI0009300D6E|nr:DUF2735 domain-containing protein [Hyphomicrobium sp. CS1GBMeth3]